MAKETTSPDVAQFIAPLNMNGLQGRMLRLPASKPAARREILLVYGQGSTLERWTGLARQLQQYGAVTVPDLPGLGGMDSFRRIGRKGTVEDYAEYLAAFVQLRYKRRRAVIVGLGTGFALAVRMCQRYPEIAKKIDLLVSIGGFLHHDDVNADRQSLVAARLLACSLAAPLARVPAGLWFVRSGLFSVMRQAGWETLSWLCRIDPFIDGPTALPSTQLYRLSDAAAQWQMVGNCLSLDVCQKRLGIATYCVADTVSKYIHNQIAEQHMRVVFPDCVIQSVSFGTSAAHQLLTPQIRRVLR